MHTYIQEQLQLHPSIMPRDVIKMCFQAAFGAEHLLTDFERVKAYFYDEYNTCATRDNLPIAEMLAPEVCRVNIDVWKNLKLPPEWLYNLFVQSASSCCNTGNSSRLPLKPRNTHENVSESGRIFVRLNEFPRKSSKEQFFSYLDSWSRYVRENGHALAFSFENLEHEIKDYCATELKPVHHSAEYRDKEAPSYRVISNEYVRLIPVLMRLNELEDTNIVISIDGRAASGKSTIAQALSTIISAEIIHMDDFFLPKELRTSSRLNEPGGNIHYERFATDVISNLKSGMPFSYPAYDCKAMDYGDMRHIENNTTIIVEGTYSHHHTFGNYSDLRILSTVDKQMQINRIVARNGKDVAKIFEDKWIPLEEAYFEAYPQVDMLTI